jgi:hypothetical protein
VFTNFVSLVKSREEEESVNSLRNISTIQRREKKRAIEIQDISLLEKALDLQYLMYGGWSEEGRKDLDIRYGETRRETKIDFYFQGKNWKMYHELCKEYSRDYFENVDDEMMLKEVLSWVESSLKNDEKPMYEDTYACLLYKLDRKEEAIKEEKKAIIKEKANGGDTKQFEENLAKMKDGTLLKK